MTVVDKCDQIHLALPICSSHTAYLNKGNAEKFFLDIAQTVKGNVDCELFSFKTISLVLIIINVGNIKIPCNI